MKTDLRTRRALRGSAAAVSATFIALTSHLLGGGSLPTAMGVIVPLALSVLVCVLLAGRRLSLWRLAPSVLLSQGLFHLLFSVFTPAHPLTTTTTAVERQAREHAGMHGSAASAGSVTDAGAGVHAHASLPMLTMHLVAAALTIALIYWAEALPARLTDLGRLLLRALVPVLTPVRALPDRPRLTVVLDLAVPRPLGVLRSPVLRRGPPLTAV